MPISNGVARIRSLLGGGIREDYSGSSGAEALREMLRRNQERYQTLVPPPYRQGTATERGFLRNADSIGRWAGTAIGAGTGGMGLGILGGWLGDKAASAYFGRNPGLVLSNPAPIPQTPIGEAIDDITRRTTGVHGDELSSPIQGGRNPYRGGQSANTFGGQGMGTGTWVGGPSTGGLTTYNRGNAIRMVKKTKDWAEVK